MADLGDSKILILGAKGQLGKQFQKVLLERKINYVAPDEKDCDITAFDEMERIIDRVAPTAIINCAAYNAVDIAETNQDLAMLINHKAVQNVARICERKGILLVHYSTDYVFDGKKGDLYNENDTPNPLNIYGKSKLAGEQAALSIGKSALVFRTSWVYGDGTQNFIFKLMGWASKNKILKISSDEVSVPTCVSVMVNTTLQAIENDLRGLYHLTNSNYCSRYEWCRFVLDSLDKNNIVIPVPTSFFTMAAQRPLFSPMSNNFLSETLGIKIPHWKISLKEFLNSSDFK